MVWGQRRAALQVAVRWFVGVDMRDGLGCFLWVGGVGAAFAAEVDKRILFLQQGIRSGLTVQWHVGDNAHITTAFDRKRQGWHSIALSVTSSGAGGVQPVTVTSSVEMF